MTSALRSRYALGEPLGTGSVGVVYRASESGGQALAIKVLDQELADNSAVMERVSKESAKLRSLRDPHLVSLKDLEIKADRVAIVMELVAGGTLADYLQLQGKLPTADALSIARQILLGLAAAHGVGLTHGRLTPQNVLLTSSVVAGPLTVKVSDYATYRLIGETEAAAAYCLTPYVAPEVVSGEAASPASDLFSVGVILYELLTGELPTAQPLRRPTRISPALWHVLAGWLSPRKARRAANTAAALKSLETLHVAAAPRRKQPPLAKPSSNAVAPLLAKSSSAPLVFAPTRPAPEQLEITPDVLEVIPDKLEVIPDTLEVIPDVLTVTPDLQEQTTDLSVVAGEVSLLKKPAADAVTVPVASPDTRPTVPARFNPPLPPEPETQEAASYEDSVPPPVVVRRSFRWTSRAKWIAALVVFAILAISGGSIYGLTSSSAKIKSFSYNFAVENSPQNDTQVQRAWTLTGGAHPVLHADIEFLAKGAGAATVDELLPTSLLAAATSVVFNPQPQHIDGNHVVRYAFGAGSNRVINASYDVAVPANLVSQQTLQSWVVQQQQQTGALYRAGHKLASITAPKSITLTIGKASKLTVGGTLADGTTAPSVALGGATYKVDNTKIATVAADGRLTGKHAGKTKVHVTLGTLTVESNVIVLAPKKAAAKKAPAIVIPSAAATNNSNTSDNSLNGLTSTAPDTTNTTPTNTNTNTNPNTGTAPTTTPTTPVKVVPPVVTPTHAPTGPTKAPVTTPAPVTTTAPAGGGGGGGGGTTPPVQPTGGPTSAPPVVQPTGTLPIVING